MKPYQTGNRFFACGEAVFIEQIPNGETHIFSENDCSRLSVSDMTFGEVYAGGENLDLKSTKVTFRSGLIKILSGGGIGGNIQKTEVSVAGGMIWDCLFGTGISDTVNNAEITVSGGAIKHSIYLAGMSKKCENAKITYENASCTYLFTGSAAADTEICGKADVNMLSGNLLGIICGGESKNNGEITVNVSGGMIEREISRKNFENKLKLRLYENIFTSNGLDLTFPLLPENADIEYLPKADKPVITQSIETNFNLFNIDNSKLSFIFFELRHPKIPRSASPFPYFIGSCVYIKFPNSENMLVDTGNDYNEKEILENLKKLNVKRLNYLIITHYHNDHIGTADLIIDKLAIDKVILPDILTIPKEKDMLCYQKLFGKLKSKNIKTEYISRGFTLNIGEVSLLCLNPIKNFSGEMNDCSIALKFTYKENSVILGGDIGENIEKDLTEIYAEKLKCDLLKLSHHGITDQTYYKYIDFCSPKAVIIDSLRPDGCFVKTTTYSLTNVNGIPPSDIYITGNNGLIKAEFSGKKDDLKIEYEYKA